MRFLLNVLIFFSKELKKKYGKNPDQLDSEKEKLNAKYVNRMVGNPKIVNPRQNISSKPPFVYF